MQTNINTKTILTRFEAQLVADWLVGQKKKVNGWTAVWRLSPEEVSRRFSVKVEDVAKAARRTELDGN